MAFAGIPDGEYTELMIKNHNRIEGFTIIELLIVIVVIAILAAISIIAYTGIQGRARDAQRLQDMRTITKALEVYKIANGNYPAAVSTPDTQGWEVSTNGTTATDFIAALKTGSTGISSVPIDPVNTASGTGAGWLHPGISKGHRMYFYFRYTPGENGCEISRGSYYVLGVTRMDGVAAGSSSPQSPGFSCPLRDWSYTGAYVVGGFVN